MKAVIVVIICIFALMIIGIVLAERLKNKETELEACKSSLAVAQATPTPVDDWCGPKGPR